MMNLESESEEEELIVGKVTKTDRAEKGTRKSSVAHVIRIAKCSNRVKVPTGYHNEDLPRTGAEDVEGETPDKRREMKKEEKCQDVLSMERSCPKNMKVGQRDSLENYPIEQKTFHRSKRRNSLPSSSAIDDSPHAPTSSKRPRILKLQSQAASRTILNVNNRVNRKDAKFEKERESSEERELIVGSGQLWFDQLTNDQIDDQKHSECESKKQEKMNTEFCSMTDAAGPVHSVDQEAGISRLDATALSEADSDDELIDPSLEIDEEEYKEGDLVWARHPWNPFWPAIVKDVVPGRQIKITVEYLNAGFDVYTCQYSVRAIRPFIRDRKKLTAVGENSEQAESFKVAVDEAMDYLEKRALGSSPVREPPPAVDCQSIDSPPLTPTECMTHPLGILIPDISSPEAGYISSPSPELRVGRPVDLVIDVAEHQQDEQQENKRKKWEQVEDRLMEQIFKDETKRRLVKIWKGKVKSSRHATYFSPSVRDRDSLKYKAKLGALITDEKIDRVAQHLEKIFREHCQEKKDDLPNTGYVFDVWLPEAILYAMMRSHRVGQKKAEDLLSTEARQVWSDLNMN